LYYLLIYVHSFYTLQDFKNKVNGQNVLNPTFLASYTKTLLPTTSIFRRLVRK